MGAKSRTCGGCLSVGSRSAAGGWPRRERRQQRIQRKASAACAAFTTWCRAPAPSQPNSTARDRHHRSISPLRYARNRQLWACMRRLHCDYQAHNPPCISAALGFELFRTLLRTRTRFDTRTTTLCSRRPAADFADRLFIIGCLHTRRPQLPNPSPARTTPYISLIRHYRRRHLAHHLGCYGGAPKLRLHP